MAAIQMAAGRMSAGDQIQPRLTSSISTGKKNSAWRVRLRETIAPGPQRTAVAVDHAQPDQALSRRLTPAQRSSKKMK